ncbi:MAG: hypothetical protein IKN17_04565 [Ruminococcus sp.]|nr:hypothetical protein [Ruminococcus sp.]
MAKICKSCGSYYKGSYCEKCGYGKEDTSSKVLEKYKKATPKKPVRFMTEEEKSAAKTKKAEKPMTRRVDPNARRNLLIAAAVVTVGVIIYVLISRGILFSNKKEDVIEQYFKALDSGDFDEFTDTLPGEIKEVYNKERSELGLSGEDYMKRFKEPLAEVYGSGFKISLEIGREEKLDRENDSEVFDLKAYNEHYGSAPTVSEVYIVYCSVTYSGSLGSDTVEYECYIAKTGWKWKIFNMEFNPGTVTAEDGAS